MRELLSQLARRGLVHDAVAAFLDLGYEVEEREGSSYGSRGSVAPDGAVCLFAGSHGDDGDEPSLYAVLR